MKVINRSALLVRPKEPYVQWANSFDKADTTPSLEEHEQEYTIYLVQEVMNENHLEQILKSTHESIFEYELAAWMADESIWPANRDYKTFLEWFNIECHSVVCDLTDEELPPEILDA